MRFRISMTQFPTSVKVLTDIKIIVFFLILFTICISNLHFSSWSVPFPNYYAFSLLANDVNLFFSLFFAIFGFLPLTSIDKFICISYIVKIWPPIIYLRIASLYFIAPIFMQKIRAAHKFCSCNSNILC